MAFTPKLTYKGKPLVRKDNELYYGRMTDPYVLYLQILTTTPVGDQQVADKVHLMLSPPTRPRLRRSVWHGRPPSMACTTRWTSAASGCRRQTLSKIEPSQALTRQLPRGESFLSRRKMLIKLSLSGELASHSDD